MERSIGDKEVCIGEWTDKRGDREGVAYLSGKDDLRYPKGNSVLLVPPRLSARDISRQLSPK